MIKTDFIPFQDEANELYIHNNDTDSEITFSNDYGMFSFYSNFNFDIENVNENDINSINKIIDVLLEAKSILEQEYKANNNNDK